MTPERGILHTAEKAEYVAIGSGILLSFINPNIGFWLISGGVITLIPTYYLKNRTKKG